MRKTIRIGADDIPIEKIKSVSPIMKSGVFLSQDGQSRMVIATEKSLGFKLTLLDTEIETFGETVVVFTDGSYVLLHEDAEDIQAMLDMARESNANEGFA